MDNAFEKARQAYGTGAYDDTTLEFLFPELLESEDDRNIDTIFNCLYQCCDTGFVSVTQRDNALAWLEKQKEQKPAEWSEEDEEMIANIISSLHGYMCVISGSKNYNNHEAYIQKEIEFLNALRPSWKPSEEHLSALLAVLNDTNNIGSQTCQLALTDLYEQLQKL